MPFTVAPASRTVGLNVDATFTVDTGVLLGTTQIILLSASPVQGVSTFTPNSAPDFGQAQQTPFSWRNTVAGTYTITLTPSTGPFNGQGAQTVQVIVSSGAVVKHPRFIHVATNRLALCVLFFRFLRRLTDGLCRCR